MGKTNYSYQTKAADEVFKDALSGSYIASVLAVAPGGGKTTISHHIINSYVAKYPNAKILVLTEGQNALRVQYLSELANPNVPVNFTFGNFNSNAQVRVGIPQSIDQVEWNNIDLLIVDEAHNFYLEPMVQNIIAKLTPKHQVLMTGSPTKYNLHNETSYEQYSMHYICAEELQEMGVYSAVDIDVVRITNKKNVLVAMQSILLDAKRKGDNLSKLMVACSTIKAANTVGEYLTTLGRKVAVSTSKNDPDSLMIERFKAQEFNTLIVVGKGILGFNDGYITLLADLRSSSNIDASFQLFARVLRKHPEGIRKAYYRVAGKDKRSYCKEVITCQKMLALMQRNIYTKYNGNNLQIKVEEVA